MKGYGNLKSFHKNLRQQQMQNTDDLICLLSAGMETVKRMANSGKYISHWQLADIEKTFVEVGLIKDEGNLSWKKVRNFTKAEVGNDTE